MHSDSDPSHHPLHPQVQVYLPKISSTTAAPSSSADATTSATPLAPPSSQADKGAGIPTTAPSLLLSFPATTAAATTNTNADVDTDTALSNASLTTALPPPSPPSIATLSFSSSIAVASSHKRSREPSAMTDPSEAARYTPPREMFRHPSANIDADDIVSLPSEDGLQESDREMQLSSTLLTSDQSRSLTLPDRFHGDSELDNLGKQLSINSPGKTTAAASDHEERSDRDTADVELETVPQSETHLVHIPDPTLEQLTASKQEQSEDKSRQAAPSFDQQLKTIQHLSRQRLELGEPMYLLNQAWYASFRKYCTAKVSGRLADHPGEIDNSVLMMGNTLRQDIQNSVTTLPQEGWDMLVANYGSITAPIMRRVVNTGSDVAPNLIIDFYPPVFTLYRVVENNQVDNPLFAMNEPDTIEVPRTTKFGDLKSALLLRLNIAGPGPARLWAIPGHANLIVEGNVIGADAIAYSGATCLEGVEDDSPVSEVNELVKCKDLALEVAINGTFLVQNATPVRPFESGFMSSTFPPSFHGSRNAGTLATQGTPVNGLCGLQNLGNTCFMNSALQCLSNTPDLTRFILAGAWRKELNSDNPLGMGGEVARAYANLIDKLWRGSSKVFSPREFKMTIGRFNPSFTGYHQHDSQELLAFLLDGLHEDLNRIVKKPYTEAPDSDGRPDEEVANDCWQLHKARNDSIIVDLFQGQYKSTLVCPECKKVSVTFDPFMYLSLPLPINKKWTGTVTYVPYDPREPLVDIRLQLPKGSTLKQLKEKVAELMGTQARHLYSAEIFSHRIYKTHENSDAVDELSDTDKNFVYELPIPDFTTASDNIVFPVHNVLEPLSSYGRPNLCGHPMMVCVTREEALDPDAIYKAIVKQASRYTTMDLYEDDSATLTINETDDEPTDVSMTPVEETSAERVPKSGLFRLMVYSPPQPAPPRSHYRPMSRQSMYAPATVPSMSDMLDMYQRVALPEPEVTHEMGSLSSHSRLQGSMGDDDGFGENDVILQPESPSLSDSSKSSNRPRVPRASDDELSDEDDLATLKTTPGINAGLSKYASKPSLSVVRILEPAVRQGEMVYCIWARSMEPAIAAPERKYRGFSSYRNMDEDEDPSSSVRVLWDERGPLVNDPEMEAERSAAKKGKKTVTLEDCLNEYTKEEQLGEEDLWYCPSCKKHQQATKKLDIWKLPDILVVHLKRFSHTRAWRDKIDALVDFPIHGLDLSGKVLKVEEDVDNMYDLYGVSNHMGGLGGGHYTAYAKNEKLGEWFNFDDSHVSAVGDVESIKSSSAYLLFYRRRNATIREYDQEPTDTEAVVEADATTEITQGPAAIFRSGYLEPFSAQSILQNDNDDHSDEYGEWGKPGSEPYSDLQPFHSMDDNSDLYDSDAELPSYGSTMMMGPSGMASPPSPFSERLTFASDKRQAKRHALDQSGDTDEEDLHSVTGMSDYLDPSNEAMEHSPDVSTCASDGSNPGTANASPRLSPPTLVSLNPDLLLADEMNLDGPPFLSSISREGGRIDLSNEIVDADGRSTSLLYSYDSASASADIPISSSTSSGLKSATPEAVRDAVDGDESEQDEVNMVRWQSSVPRG
ncbi:hypothetical protein BC939DRAFT_480534 [Gamsiella multidivaricata]|uniref:uncharacterized protein n=1 Tax=Gamsiella multidivaricata TaxID=101098 RepID=UPI00221E9004|nr:uncharacterized protein BC939DRAFT_480534 [Gamsiella multidivaricata]KAI7818214.1 hypothetical protein BC939DRAFT_480534 [Gamsiella multidivaricata]